MSINRLSRRRLLTNIQAAGAAVTIVFGAIAGTAHSCHASPARTAVAASAIVTDDLIYLYEDGEPVLQPTDYIVDGGVYTETGAFVGTVDPNTDDILDSNNDVIGYVESDGPP